MIKVIEYKEKIYKIKENHWPNFKKCKVNKKKFTKSKEIRFKSDQIFVNTKLRVSKHFY